MIGSSKNKEAEGDAADAGCVLIRDNALKCLRALFYWVTLWL